MDIIYGWIWIRDITMLTKKGDPNEYVQERRENKEEEEVKK